MLAVTTPQKLGMVFAIALVAGWAMWLVVHLVNVVSFRSRILVLINWAWDYLFYDRPIRLILRAKDDHTSQTDPTRG